MASEKGTEKKSAEADQELVNRVSGESPDSMAVTHAGLQRVGVAPRPKGGKTKKMELKHTYTWNGEIYGPSPAGGKTEVPEEFPDADSLPEPPSIEPPPAGATKVGEEEDEEAEKSEAESKRSRARERNRRAGRA